VNRVKEEAHHTLAFTSVALLDRLVGAEASVRRATALAFQPTDLSSGVAQDRSPSTSAVVAQKIWVVAIVQEH
jgi:hypothetical protein